MNDRSGLVVDNLSRQVLVDGRWSVDNNLGRRVLVNDVMNGLV